MRRALSDCSDDHVALRTEAYFRTIAERALAEAGIVEPPVSLERLAEHLCVPIRRVMLPGFFRGAVVNEDGMPVIVINAAHTQQRQRDTLAHLLGHIVLVHDGGIYPRDSEPEHHEADAVARELILPYEMVLRQSKLWFNDYRYLARGFGVHEVEMLARMRALGIIKGPRGISWDY